MGCKGIKSELNSTLFDCYVRNPTQKATPFSLDYLRNQIKSRLIMTYNFTHAPVHNFSCEHFFQFRKKN